MHTRSSTSRTGSYAFALLLSFALGCGRHDTPVAIYQAAMPDAGEAGSGGVAGAAAAAGAAAMAGAAGTAAAAGTGGGAGGPACAPSYTTIVEGLTSRYREEMTGKVWVEAELDCESDGGHLIVIDDDVENTYASTVAAKAITNNKSTHQLGWLGGGDSASEGNFEWVTGAALSLEYWSTGEPNMAFKDEDCLEMRATAQWNDDRCDARLVYVCECDGTASAGTWCDSNAESSCGDCTTACAADQSCVKQQCQ